MQEFDETYDFVVVGSGGGSMCAGLLMRSLGKSVLILEKTDKIGGTTARSGGTMWIPNNSLMKRDGVEDSTEKALTYLDAAVGDRDDAPGASAERRRAYVVEAPRMADFIMSQGVRLLRPDCWPDYYDELPGGSVPGRTMTPALFDLNKLGTWKNKLRPGFLPLPLLIVEAREIANMKQSFAGKLMIARVGFRKIFNRLTGRHVATAGESLQGQMLYAATRRGVEFRTEAPVSELVIDGDAVVGVISVKDGKPWRVGARLGVLVNAGGFAHNQAMRDRYQPGTRADWSNAIKGDTGEMIEEMARHGGALAQMEEMVGNQQTIPPGAEAAEIRPAVQSITAAPHAILVDQSGLRYLNEGGSYMAYCKAMFERDKTVPAVPSWAIFDAQYVRKYMLNGTLAGTKKPQRWYDQGYLKQADTVEGLAASLSIDPATLRATVDRFNGFARQGRDDDFQRGVRAYDNWLGDPTHRPSATLGTIEEGPFYAIPVVPGDVGTFGGVVTDAHARVLRADGSVIAGLYATGVSTAAVMGRVYPGAGCSVGPSFVFGYIAAKHAANADNLAA